MVSLNRQNLLHLLLVVLLCDNVVQSAPPSDSFLPTVKMRHHKLTPSANRYNYRIPTYSNVPFSGGSYNSDHGYRAQNKPKDTMQNPRTLGIISLKLSAGGAKETRDLFHHVNPEFDYSDSYTFRKDFTV